MKIENKQIFDNLIRICCHKFQAKLTLTLLLIHSEYHGTSHCIAYVVIRCNNGYSVCALNVHQHHMPQRVPCASRATASNMRDRKTLSLGVHRARRQTHSFCVHMPYTNAYRIYSVYAGETKRTSLRIKGSCLSVPTDANEKIMKYIKTMRMGFWDSAIFRNIPLAPNSYYFIFLFLYY